MQSSLYKPATSLLDVRASSLTGRVSIILSASIFVAICAHVSFPLPFTPVPLTLSNFAVILVGLLLGPVAGFAAMLAYLAEGAAGLPVFSPQGPGGLAQLLGPTAGFLFSYPLAAALAGAFARLSSALPSRFVRGLLAGAIASLPIFALGSGWLAHLTHLGIPAAWHLAIAPFLPGEIVKVAAAAGIYRSLQARSAI